MANFSKGFVNTEPLNAPAAQTGVMNQLRYWGMGQGQQRTGLPELQSNMQKYKLSAISNLSQLEKRATELRAGDQEAKLAMQAGAAEDQSNLQHQQWDAQQGDWLDVISRGVAGTAALGQGVLHVAEELNLDGLAEFVNKMPLVGKSKESEKLNKAYEKVLKSFQTGSKRQAKFLAQAVEMYSGVFDVYRTMQTPEMKSVLAERGLDSLIIDPEIFAEWEVNLDNLNESLAELEGAAYGDQ